MKTKRKALLLSLGAVLLVTASVLFTLAYLTSTDEVVNTFTVGNVQIKLDEAQVDESGKKVESGNRVKANSYHLLPGHEYDKDPTVTVLAGSDESYVRMLVTMNKQNEINGIEELEGDLSEIFTGHHNEIWEYKGSTKDEGSNTIVYEFRYHDIVAKAGTDTELPALFTEFTLPEEINNADLAKLEDFEIKVVAQAIQADGFADADAAWAAFGD